MYKKTKPNLFIIGSMKSGTTSLHNYLNQHPQIYMSDEKEPGYFVEELSLHKGENWYLDLFSNVSNEIIIGESSTHYSKFPIYNNVPKRIKSFNSQARFIYIMRDPIERIISHYWHNVRWEGEYRSIINAVKKDPQYISYSNYFMQLNVYLQEFSPDSIYCITFEELIKYPENTLKDIFHWLSVDSSYTLISLDRKWNELPKSFYKVRGMGILHRLRHNELWSVISPYFPSTIKSIGIKLSKKPTQKNLEHKDELIKYLRPIITEQVTELSNMLNRDFNEWKTLFT